MRVDMPPPKRRLSQLPKLILVRLYQLGRDSSSVRHWNLLLAVASAYKFTGMRIEKMPPSFAVREVVHYGKVQISKGKKDRQYIDQAFQVAFSRSLRTLEEKGFVLKLGYSKTTKVILRPKAVTFAKSLIAKVLPPRKARLIAKMPVAVPKNKRPSVARIIEWEFEKLMNTEKSRSRRGRKK